MKLVVHYDEITLKGQNRYRFENKLVENIRFALKKIAPKIRTHLARGRIIVNISEPCPPWQQVCERLQHVIGIAYFAQIFRCQTDMQDLRSQLLQKLPDINVNSFAVRTKREDKNFPLNSMEIEQQVGAWVHDQTQWPVKLKNPQLTIRIEWLTDQVLFYFGRKSAPGGLPVGSSDTILCLLSGGIDSPVASYMMMKRGCKVTFIHFHSFPFTNADSQQKVQELVECLCRYRMATHLYMVPFAEVQQEIVTNAPSPYRVLLYRRFMVRIAEKLAENKKIGALLTGESLGQVASQTLPNIRVIENAVDLPVLRPLIGMSKGEIIEIARKIGTYEVSIQPHDDCCSFMIPKRPRTRSSIAKLEAIEQQLPVSELVDKAVSKLTCQEISGFQ